MGREIRRVPPNWEHPLQECRHSPWRGGCDQAKKNGGKCFHPLHDRSFREAAEEWKANFLAYDPSQHDGDEFWEYHGNPPEREYYRPDWKPEEATWFQVYETVSEGSPITPPFATKDELIDWLCANKDFWGKGPLTRRQAEAFVNDEWAPSLIVCNGVISEGMEIPAAMEEEK